MQMPLEHYPHLAEVMPSALSAVGVSAFENRLNFAATAGMCVFLIDGLGWELLEHYADDAPVLTAMAKRPLRSGIPSTTSAGLAAIGTGMQSGEHGMIGYSFNVPGVGVLNALRWTNLAKDKDFRSVAPPEQIQNRSTVYERARQAGFVTSVISPEAFSDSGLTRAVHRGGHYVGAHTLSDIALAIPRSLRVTPTVCFAYYRELDAIGHFQGPGSSSWRKELRRIDRMVESLIEALPSERTLTIVADHGMVTLDDSVVDVDSVPEWMSGIRLIAGEARTRHFYVDDAAQPDVLASWRERLAGHAWVTSREEAIADGWFGPSVADHVRSRIGDIVIAAQGNFGLLRSRVEPGPFGYIGHHGSFTSAEQLVPLATLTKP